MYFIGILRLRYISLKNTPKKSQQQAANNTLTLSSEEL